MGEIKDFKAKVFEKHQLTEHVYQVGLRLSGKMAWEAGQYVSVAVGPKGTGANGLIKRSYSICSRPSHPNYVEFCVDTKPAGPGGEFIRELKISDEVTLKGPLGNFVLEEPAARGGQLGKLPTTGLAPNYVFVAAGTGIGPFKAMIPLLLNKLRDEGRQETGVELFFGLRHERDIFYREFFESNAIEFENFRFHIVLSQPLTNSWQGLTGHVTEHVLKTAESSKLKAHSYYLCGNMEMIREVTNGLVDKGVKRENIHFENYF